MTISEAYDSLRRELMNFGRLQRDNRLKRDTLFLPRKTVTLDYKAARKIKVKYLVDFGRMKSSFYRAIKLAKKDPTSRRIVSFNTLYYERNYQCFLIMQFVQAFPGEYDMVIFQRSGDLSKFKDDANFFMFVAKEFKDKLKCKIHKVTIFYAHVHKQTD